MQPTHSPGSPPGSRPPLRSSRLLEQVRERFLTHLATARGVSASTHKQALAAILFLYRHVLDLELPWMQDIGRPKPRLRVPVVLSREDVAALLARMEAGPAWLVASLLYGAGLRLGEALELRVKDVDFGRHVLVLRQAKGFKERVVMLPASLQQPLRAAPDSFRALRRIRCATRSRRTCWTRASTSAASRNCRVMRTSARR